MRTSDLKALSYDKSRNLKSMGVISRFEMLYRDFLNGEIKIPDYTNEDILRIRQKIGASQEDIARLLGITYKTVLRWEKAGQTIPSPICVLFCLFDKLEEGYFDLLKAEPGRYTLCKENESISEPESDSKNQSLMSRLIRKRLSLCPEQFHGADVVQLRNQFELTRVELAELLQISSSTVDKWEADAATPTGPDNILLRMLWVRGPKVLSTSFLLSENQVSPAAKANSKTK